MEKHKNINIDEKLAGLERLKTNLLELESLKDTPETLKEVMDIVNKIIEIESKKEDTFFKTAAKCSGNKISKYVSYEPEDNEKVNEIFGDKRPNLVAYYRRRLSFLEVVDQDDYIPTLENKEKLLAKINDTKKKIELACKFKKKMAIVYTKTFKNQISKMYSQLSSEEKKFVKLLYIDPKRDEIVEMVIAIRKWLIWSEIPYNKAVSARHIFTSK